MREIRFVFFLIFGAMHCALMAADSSALKLQANGVTVEVNAKNGIAIGIDGIPFSLGSSFSVMSKDWTHAWYTNHHDQLAEFQAMVERFPGGGGRITIPIREDDQLVSGSRVITLFPDRRVSIGVDISNTSTSDLLLEHRIAGIDAGWISGMTWKGNMTDGATTSGRLAREAVSGEVSQNTVLKNIRDVGVDSRGGKLKISVHGDAPISLVDYRKNQWADGLKYYWFGVLSSPISGTGLHYSVEFLLPAKMKISADKWVSGDSKITSVSEVLLPEDRADEIVPTPKNLQWGSGELRIPNGVSLEWKNGNGFAEVAKREHGTGLITAAIDSLFGEAATTVDKGASVPIKISENSFSQLVDSHNRPLDEALRNEAYTLKVDDHVEISARSTSGVLNALKTLRQLLRRDANGAVMVRRCVVTDYPSLPFRGVHFFTGRNARDLQIHMVRDILGALKINELVYQCDYLEWDSSPVLRHPEYGMSKADAAAVDKAAVEEGIEVIPLVNTFGHSEWLLDYPEMRHLADDPGFPFAYDPSNPEVYKLCDAIYGEALDLFHPRIMHIGHDEIDYEGFPVRPSNRAVGTTELVARDIRHYHDLLSSHGVKTMMWGDMLLASGEAPDATLAKSVEQARERRSALPKDIVIADWHYAPAKPEAFKSLKILNDAGFKSIGCTCDTVANIVNFTRAADAQREKDSRCLGILQTTWAGYNFDEKGFLAHTDQYAAYVMAAEMAWTGASEKDAAKFDYQRVFARLWNAGVLPPEKAGGWTVALPGIERSQLNVIGKRFAWNPEALNNIAASKQKLGRFQFATGGQTALPMLLMSGGFNGPRAGGINDALMSVNQKAEAIALALGATVTASKGALMGNMEITLGDGNIKRVPLVMGENVSALSDDVSSLNSPVWWSCPAKSGEAPFAVHGLLWQNKTPGVKITSIRIRTGDSGSALVIFGIAGIDGGK